MTRLGFKLGGGLGTPEPIPADSTTRAVRGIIGGFGIGGAPIGGLSDVFYPYEFNFSESINFLQDQVVIPQGAPLSFAVGDDLNLLSSIISLVLRNELNLTPSDQLQQFNDMFAQEFAERYVNTVDALWWAPGSFITLSLKDSARIQNLLIPNPGIAISDTLQELLDAILVQGGEPDYTISLVDSISIYFLADSCNLIGDFPISFTDELEQLTEEITSQSPIAVVAYDSLQYNWDDEVVASFIMVIQVSDALDQLLESVQAVISTTVLTTRVSDDLNNLVDAIIDLRSGLELYIQNLNNNDIIVLTDSIQVKMDHLLTRAEQLQQLLDLLILFSGDTNFADSLQQISEAVSVVLSGAVGVSDSLNNLSDSATIQIGPTVLNATFSDSINNLSDEATVTLRNPLLTLIAADSINFLVDHLSETEGIIPGTIDVSRIRRYLGDLVN